MTELDELVNQQNDNTTIAIGSKTGYFFFGTKAEYEEKIDKLSDELFGGMLKSSRNGFTNFRRRVKKAQLAAAKGEFVGNDEIHRISALLNSALKNAARVVRFVPLRERKVSECYPGIWPANIKIIVEGDEEACFWTEDEYRAAEM